MAVAVVLAGIIVSIVAVLVYGNAPNPDEGIMIMAVVLLRLI